VEPSTSPARHHWRLAPLAIAACAIWLGCGRGDAREPSSTAELRARMLADSAAGDRAALITLPPRLQEILRLEPYLDDSYIRETPDAECREVDAALPERLRAERRQVRLPLPDSSTAIVYVRVAAASGSLERVEVVRRPVEGEQLYFIWDGAQDRTVEVRWPRERRGRPESAPQPRGGPIPRAIRALGRRALVLDCEPAPADTALEAVLEGSDTRQGSRPSSADRGAR